MLHVHDQFEITVTGLVVLTFTATISYALQKLALQTMFLRVKRVKSNPYFYLVENERVEGKSTPIQRVIEYLGNQNQAIATLSDSDYPGKDQLLARVRAAAPAQGKNHGKRGRPRKADGHQGLGTLTAGETS